MSLFKTIDLAHVPEDVRVHVALFENVKNAGFLQQQLLDGNSAFEYAFIDASVILSSTHLLAAVFRAVNDWRNGRLKSKNIHSEIVFCLSMNNNIAESFRRFGITPSTTSLLAIKVSTSPSVNVGAVERHLLESIEGTSLPFDDSEIARFTDMAKVQKIYKLAGVVRGSESCNSKKMKVEQEKKEGIDNTSSTSRKEDAERKRLESLVLGLMALRGAT